MERFCGMLANSGKSRPFPWASLSNRILDIAQLNHVKVLYRLDEELDLRGQPGVPGKTYVECTWVYCEHCSVCSYSSHHITISR